MADGSTVSIGGVEIEILAANGKFNRTLTQSEQRARTAGTVMTREFDKADRAAARLDATLRRGASALALFGVGFGAGMVVRSVIEAADAMTQLRGRIAGVVTEGESLTRVQRDLFTTAQANRASLEATSQLYLRLRQSVADLNHEQALSLTSTFAKTLVISGASAAEAASSMTQFSQAMASGRLQGDELRSLLENNSRFARLLADSLGVTIGELRALGEAGALTTDVIAKSMTSGAATVETEFEKIPLTVGQAMTQLQNALLVYIGDTDKSLGASARLAQGISFLTENLEGLLDALIAISAGAAVGAGIVGIAKVTESAIRMGLAIKEALSDIAAGTNPAYKKFAEPAMKAFLDAEKAALQYQAALAAVTRAEANLAAAQAAGNSTRSIAAFKGQVTRAQNYADSLQVIATTSAAVNDKLQADFKASTNAIGSRFQQLGTIAGRVGSSILGAFGGPLGLAITAASIAMAVFTYNTLQADKAARVLANDLDKLEGIHADLKAATLDLAAQNAVLEQAIRDQAPAAEETARREIDAISERIRKNKELQEVYANAIRAGLQAAEAQDRTLDKSQRQAILGTAADSIDLSPAENKAIANYRDRQGDIFRALGGGGVFPDFDQDMADSIINRAHEQAKADLAAQKELTKAQQAVLDYFKVTAARDAEIADQKQRLADALKEPETEDNTIPLYMRRYTAAIDAARKSTQSPEVKSALAASAIKNMAERDLEAAKGAIDGIRDLLTDKDEIDVERTFEKIRKSITRTTTDVKNKLQEFRKPAEDFAVAIAEIRKADKEQGNKSLATLQAIVDFGKEAKDIPDAIRAIDSVMDLLTPEDAARARDELGKLARDNATNFGNDNQRLLYGYAEALKKINDAEAALIATGQKYDPASFNEARAQLAEDLNNSFAELNPRIEQLDSMIRDMLTPTEKLASELAELELLRRAAGTDTTAQQAIGRKRIQLLEDEARATGYAARALATLRSLQGGSGYSQSELKAIRDRITAAAGEGYAAGNRPADSAGAQAAQGEAASRYFATKFTEAITQGIRSGDFGEAVRQTLASAAADALTQAITDIGKWAGDALFGEGGVFAGALDFFTPETIGDSAKAAAEATATASLTGLAASSTAAMVAQDTAAAAATVALGALTAAAVATAAALTAIGATTATSEGAGLLGTILTTFGTGAPGRAHGGRGFAGEPMIVGEAGREIFIPGADGYVVPNSALKGSSALYAGAGGRLMAISIGGTVVQGDVGSRELLRDMRMQQEARDRQLPRVIKATILEMERRRQ